MGNACCRGTTSTSIDDDSDRAQILTNNYDRAQSNGQAAPAGYYNNYINATLNDEIPYGSFSCGNKSREQAALDMIYHQLALNVIDVAPGETMIIEPAEIFERQKAYHTRLNQLQAPLSLSLTKTGGVHNPLSAHKLVSRIGKIVPREPTSDSNNIINRQKLYQIPDRRRVEYEAIPQDEEELIREYSLLTVEAVKSLTPTMSEPVITQFSL